MPVHVRDQLHQGQHPQARVEPQHVQPQHVQPQHSALRTQRWSERVEYTAPCPACGRDATWVSDVELVRDASGFVRHSQGQPDVLCCR